MELDLQDSPEEIMSRQVGWAGLRKLDFFRFEFSSPQQQCNGHCLCDSAQTRQLKQQLYSALVAGQWRGDTALTLPLFWRRSTVSFGRYPWLSLHSFVPPVPNNPPCFCGRKAKWSSCKSRLDISTCAHVHASVCICVTKQWFLWLPELGIFNVWRC